MSSHVSFVCDVIISIHQCNKTDYTHQHMKASLLLVLSSLAS